MKTHPLAAIFPALPEEEFQALKGSVLAHGLIEPITTYEDMVLDGANRARACAELGIKPRTEPYKGADPLGFVVSKNLTRRHLNASQRAMVAARIANMRQGERTDLEPTEPSANLPKVSRAKAASALKVSPRSVTDAKRVIEHGSPALVYAVETGAIKVSAAKAITSLPTDEQQRIAQESDPKVHRTKFKKATQPPAIEPEPVAPVEQRSDYVRYVNSGPPKGSDQWPQPDMRCHDTAWDCAQMVRVLMVAALPALDKAGRHRLVSLVRTVATEIEIDIDRMAHSVEERPTVQGELTQ